MNTLRCDDQDPDYFMLFSRDIGRQNIFEKNACANTANKISTIIEAEFLNEITNKKSEIYKIYNNLNKACKMLHYLRFAIVTDFYNQENICNHDVQTLKQSRLHCTVNPFTYRKASIKDIGYRKNFSEKLDVNIKRKRKTNDECSGFKNKCSQNKNSENLVFDSILLSTTCKIKKRIIVGNISKWIIPDFRNGNASHKWTIYVRDSHKCDIGQFISKVRFFLHPSYKPNDVVELTSTPFHLSRHGWGEFPIRVQLHFTNSFNKPVDIIHYLKLDRTFTGLQTIGSETIVDLWINMKDTLTEPDLKESNQKIVSISNKYNQSNKKISLSNHNYFLNDHNYMGTNFRYDGKTSYYLQKSQEFTDSESYISHSNITASEKYLTFNLKTKNNETLTKSGDILPKAEPEELLIKKNLFKHNFIQNPLINNKYRYEYINHIKSAQNYSHIDSKIVYFKQNNYINNEENFKALVNLIEYTKPSTLFNILKLLIKKIPLIMKTSSESYYKMLYPYVSESYQQFYNYSKGKQESLERYRAICALNIIRSTNYYNSTCNTNELIIWARRYCYTPFLNLKNISKIYKSIESINIKDESRNHKHTSTISKQLSKWLLQCQRTNQNVVNFNAENDQIDILNTSSNIQDSLSMYHNRKKKIDTLVFIEYPGSDDILSDFVCKSMQKIGIKLVNEEIIPGVLHQTASLLITKAVNYFIDDLIRLAFSCALDKSKNKRNVLYIKIDDVRTALLKKEEFEIFTNAGLGSEG